MSLGGLPRPRQDSGFVVGGSPPPDPPANPGLLDPEHRQGFPRLATTPDACPQNPLATRFPRRVASLFPRGVCGVCYALGMDIASARSCFPGTQDQVFLDAACVSLMPRQ